MSDPTTHNAYPELPVIDYAPTQVPMQDVIQYIQSLTIPVGLQRTVYTVFRIEGANGHDGINNNYCGAQADGDRWPEQYTPLIAGTVLKRDSSGSLRRFVAFTAWHTSVDLLADRLGSHGIFPDGDPAITNTQDLCNAYYRHWVTGLPDATPPTSFFITFSSIFNQAIDIFKQAADA